MKILTTSISAILINICGLYAADVKIEANSVKVLDGGITTEIKPGESKDVLLADGKKVSVKIKDYTDKGNDIRRLEILADEPMALNALGGVFTLKAGGEIAAQLKPDGKLSLERKDAEFKPDASLPFDKQGTSMFFNRMPSPVQVAQVTPKIIEPKAGISSLPPLNLNKPTLPNFSANPLQNTLKPDDKVTIQVPTAVPKAILPQITPTKVENVAPKPILTTPEKVEAPKLANNSKVEPLMSEAAIRRKEEALQDKARYEDLTDAEKIASRSGFVPANPSSREVNAKYHVRVNDVLNIAFFTNPQDSNYSHNKVRVDWDGKILIPYVTKNGQRSIYAAGKTPARIVEEIEALTKKNGSLATPKVNVTIDKFDDRSFVIMGQASKPGRYVFREGIKPEMDILEAIGQAEGFTRLARQSKVLVKRAENVYTVDVEALATKPGYDRFIVIPGDIITVPERKF